MNRSLSLISSRAHSWRVVPTLPENAAALAIDPARSSTIYAAGGEDCDAYKSTNGGRGWPWVALYACVHAFAMDPANSRTIYAGTADGVFKSTDAGRSWKLWVCAVGSTRPAQTHKHRSCTQRPSAQACSEGQTEVGAGTPSTKG